MVFDDSCVLLFYDEHNVCRKFSIQGGDYKEAESRVGRGRRFSLSTAGGGPGGSGGSSSPGGAEEEPYSRRVTSVH